MNADNLQAAVHAMNLRQDGIVDIALSSVDLPFVTCSHFAKGINLSRQFNSWCCAARNLFLRLVFIQHTLVIFEINRKDIKLPIISLFHTTCWPEFLGRN